MFKNRIKNVKKNKKKGITLIQLFFVIAIAIVLLVVFNPLDLVYKVTRGNKTVAWGTELSNISNEISISKDKNNMLFTTVLMDDTIPYNVTLQAPPVSAYADVKKLQIEKNSPTTGDGNTDRFLTYEKNGTIKYNDTGSIPLSATATLSDYKYNSEVASTGLKLPGFTSGGSDGIAPFINKSISKVEEDLFYGLMGAQKTRIGVSVEKKGKAEVLSSATKPDLKSFLEMAFGPKLTSDTYPFYKPDLDRWVKIVQIDGNAVKELTGKPSRFTDPKKNRIFLVTNVVTQEEAFKVADKALGTKSDPTATGHVQKDTDLIKELYEEVVTRIKEDTVLVMPAEKSSAVYSESSEFRRIKFGLGD